jgi:hypothetical protein
MTKILQIHAANKVLFLNLLSEWLIRVTYWPPNHKSTKLLSYKHLIIIDIIASAEIFRIQILTTELKIKN